MVALLWFGVRSCSGIPAANSRVSLHSFIELSLSIERHPEETLKSCSFAMDAFDLIEIRLVLQGCLQLP